MSNPSSFSANTTNSPTSSRNHNSSYPLNPLRSNPHTSVISTKSERTLEWARSLTPLPPSDSSEFADVGDEARDRSRYSDTMVRLTTSPEGLTRLDEGRPWTAQNRSISDSLAGMNSPGTAGSFGRPQSAESQGGLLKANSRGEVDKKAKIRMLTDEERMRKEIQMLETPTERIAGKRPGGWRWWFGID